MREYWLEPKRHLFYYYALHGYNDNSSHRPVSPGPESRYLSNVDLSTPRPECECSTHEKNRRRSNSDDGSALTPVGQKHNVQMFTPSWRRDDRYEERSRSVSPSWRSFSEAAFGGTGDIETIRGYLAPSNSPRHRHLSYDCDRSTAGSQTNAPTNVNRLARSGSAASLAVVMASTFPNGGDPDFNLEGTAAKISQVCDTVNCASKENQNEEGVAIKKSRSLNSCLNVNHAANVERASTPINFDQQREIKMRRSAEKKSSPMKAMLTYRQIKDLQEKLSKERVVSYQDLVTCPRNRLPDHIDKSRLQDYLSDKEFWTVFAIDRDGFNEMPEWKQIKMKKECWLF